MSREILKKFFIFSEKKLLTNFEIFGILSTERGKKGTEFLKGKEKIKMENNNTKVVGLGFFDVLAIVFIVLKLCGVITWSWIWVLAPLWGQIAIIGLIVVVGVPIVIIVNKIRDKKVDKKFLKHGE